ncbi:uncharacterized protein EV422DRAFT_480534, partial [Fimicolochytrium jonesii]|uniref:uncharacterized protein n=1 Tax=Fimicolochytrium jonesii TaxID=1396493 RepID=UPI0022FF1147
LAAPTPQACFISTKSALPAEVASSIPALARTIRCSTTTFLQTSPTKIPDLISGSTSFSSIDFRNSALDPLGFALANFAVNDPKTANLATLTEKLNVYLAFEAALRSSGASTSALTKAKVPKFFLQFQLARVEVAQTGKTAVAGGVEHQRAKVSKNAAAIRASQAELKELAAIKA